MTVLEEAIELVAKLDDGYDFWQLCRWTAEQPGGHVVIYPDFIGIAQLDGEVIKVWLAIGKDGVRKAIELAPPSAKCAQWMRGIYDKNDRVRHIPIARIKRYLDESVRNPSETQIHNPAHCEAGSGVQGHSDHRWSGGGKEHGHNGNTERHGLI